MANNDKYTTSLLNSLKKNHPDNFPEDYTVDNFKTELESDDYKNKLLASLKKNHPNNYPEDYGIENFKLDLGLKKKPISEPSVVGAEVSVAEAPSITPEIPPVTELPKIEYKGLLGEEIKAKAPELPEVEIPKIDKSEQWTSAEFAKASKQIKKELMPDFYEEPQVGVPPAEKKPEKTEVYYERQRKNKLMKLDVQEEYLTNKKDEAIKKMEAGEDIPITGWQPEINKINRQIAKVSEEKKLIGEPPKETFDKLTQNKILSDSRDVVEGYLGNLETNYKDEYKNIVGKLDRGHLSEYEQFNAIINPAFVSEMNKLNNDIDILEDRGWVDITKRASELREQLIPLTELSNIAKENPTPENTTAYNIEYEKQKPTIDEYNILTTENKKEIDIVNKTVNEYNLLLNKYNQTIVKMGEAIEEPETEWGVGSYRALIESFATMYESFENLGKTIADISGIGDILATYGVFEKDWRETHKGIAGQLEGIMVRGVENLPTLPDNVLGKSLEGFINFIPLMLELQLPVGLKLGRLPKLAGGTVVKIPRLGVIEGSKGFFNTYANSVGQDANQLQTIGRSFVNLGLGMESGIIMHGVGIGSAEVGKFASKIVKGSIIPTTATAIAGGGGFGIYDAFNQYVATGEIDWTQVSASVGTGVAITVPGIMKAIYTDAYNQARSVYYSSSNEVIKFANNVKESPLELSKKITELNKKILKETDTEIQNSLIKQRNALTNLNFLKLASEDVASNPEKHIEEIKKDTELKPEEKKYFIEKIEQTKKDVEPPKKTETQELISDEAVVKPISPPVPKERINEFRDILDKAKVKYTEDEGVFIGKDVSDVITGQVALFGEVYDFKHRLTTPLKIPEIIEGRLEKFDPKVKGELEKLKIGDKYETENDTYTKIDDNYYLKRSVLTKEQLFEGVEIKEELPIEQTITDIAKKFPTFEDFIERFKKTELSETVEGEAIETPHYELGRMRAFVEFKELKVVEERETQMFEVKIQLDNKDIIEPITVSGKVKATDVLKKEMNTLWKEHKAEKPVDIVLEKDKYLLVKEEGKYELYKGVDKIESPAKKQELLIEYTEKANEKELAEVFLAEKPPPKNPLNIAIDKRYAELTKDADAFMNLETAEGLVRAEPEITIPPKVEVEVKEVMPPEKEIPEVKPEIVKREKYKETKEFIKKELLLEKRVEEELETESLINTVNPKGFIEEVKIIETGIKPELYDYGILVENYKGDKYIIEAESLLKPLEEQGRIMLENYQAEVDFASKRGEIKIKEKSEKELNIFKENWESKIIIKYVKEKITPPKVKPEIKEEVKPEEKKEVKEEPKLPEEYITKDGNYILTRTKEGFDLFNLKTGKKIVSKPTIDKIIDEYKHENIEELKKGKEAVTEKEFEKLTDETEYESKVEQESENPKEIAQVYLRQEAKTKEVGMSDEGIIADSVGKNISPESFKRQVGKAHVTKQIARNYFRKGGTTLDAIARDIILEHRPELGKAASDMLTREEAKIMTDIAEFMIENPGGARQYWSKLKSATNEIKYKFKEVTGFDIDKKFAEELTTDKPAVDRWIDNLKKSKIPTDAPAPFMLAPKLYNTAVDIVIAGLRAGKSIDVAISNAIRYIKEHLEKGDTFSKKDEKSFASDMKNRKGRYISKIAIPDRTELKPFIEKVTGIKKEAEKVLVDEYEALKSQLKIEEIVGKDIQKQVKERQEILNKFISDRSDLINKLAIKLKPTILKKISKIEDIGSLSEAMNYIDNIITKAEFRAEEIKKVDLTNEIIKQTSNVKLKDKKGLLPKAKRKLLSTEAYYRIEKLEDINNAVKNRDRDLTGNEIKNIYEIADLTLEEANRVKNEGYKVLAELKMNNIYEALESQDVVTLKKELIKLARTEKDKNKIRTEEDFGELENIAHDKLHTLSYNFLELMNSKEIEQKLNDVKQIIDDAKTLADIEREEYSEMIEEHNVKVKDYSAPKIKERWSEKKKKRLELKTGKEAANQKGKFFEPSQLYWSDASMPALLFRMSQHRTDKTDIMNSFLVTEVYKKRVMKSEDSYFSGMREISKKHYNACKNIYGVKTDTGVELAIKKKASKKNNVDISYIEIEKGKEVEKTETYTQYELATMWLLYQDATTHDTFFHLAETGKRFLKGEGWTEKSVKQMEEGLDLQVKKHAEWLLQEEYPSLRERYTHHVREQRGFGIEGRPDYSPALRTGLEAKEQDGTDLLDRSYSKSILGSMSLAKRKGSLAPFKKISMLDNYQNYVVKMEEYLHYSDLAKYLNRLFRNRETKNILKQYYSKSFRDELNFFIDKFSGERDINKHIFMDKLNSLFAGGVLAAKFSIPTKQLFSAIMWSAELDNPLKIAKAPATIIFNKQGQRYLRDSELIKGRGFEATGLNIDMFKKSVIGNKPILAKMMKTGLSGIKYADIMAIKFGVEYYKQQYKKYRKTLPDKEAHELAIADADFIGHITQQSWRPSIRSKFRSNAWGRAITPFTSAVKLLGEYEIMSYNELGRGHNVKRNIQRLAVTKILAGAFALAGNSFDWDSNEMGLAFLLGSQKGIAILGNSIEIFIDLMTDKEMFAAADEAIPVLGNLKNIFIDIHDAAQGFQKPITDWESVLKNSKKAIAKISNQLGFPIGGIIKTGEDIINVASGETDKWLVTLLGMANKYDKGTLAIEYPKLEDFDEYFEKQRGRIEDEGYFEFLDAYDKEVRTKSEKEIVKEGKITYADELDSDMNFSKTKLEERYSVGITGNKTVLWIYEHQNTSPKKAKWIIALNEHWDEDKFDEFFVDFVNAGLYNKETKSAIYENNEKLSKELKKIEKEIKK